VLLARSQLGRGRAVSRHSVWWVSSHGDQSRTGKVAISNEAQPPHAGAVTVVKKPILQEAAGVKHSHSHLHSQRASLAMS
jgi:hypothetical protein